MFKVKLIINYSYQEWDGNSKYKTFKSSIILTMKWREVSNQFIKELLKLETDKNVSIINMQKI